MKLWLRQLSLVNASRVQHLARYDSTQVEYMTEKCIGVNENDEVCGSVSKEEAHSSNQLVLHRAFSVFSFSSKNKLLMQKRSSEKITFPNLWTNTCCSHPLHNERELEGVIGVKRAAVRKLEHELGITGISKSDFSFQGRFIYQAEMENEPWGEHELDYALILRGIEIDRCKINENEVSDVREVTYRELLQWIEKEPASFTPWMKLFSKTETFAKWWDMHKSTRIKEDSCIYRLN